MVFLRYIVTMPNDTDQPSRLDDADLAEFLDFQDDFRADPAFVKREKAKAQELRNSQWWKNLRATGKCHYCGRVFRPQDLTMDHIVPIARGGRSTHGNIVPACKECNAKKRYLLPSEWQEYLDHLASDSHPSQPSQESH